MKTIDYILRTIPRNKEPDILRLTNVLPSDFCYKSQGTRETKLLSLTDEQILNVLNAIANGTGAHPYISDLVMRDVQNEIKAYEKKIEDIGKPCTTENNDYNNRMSNMAMQIDEIMMKLTDDKINSIIAVVQFLPADFTKLPSSVRHDQLKNLSFTLKLALLKILVSNRFTGAHSLIQFREGLYQDIEFLQNQVDAASQPVLSMHESAIRLGAHARIDSLMMKVPIAIENRIIIAAGNIPSNYCYGPYENHIKILKALDASGIIRLIMMCLHECPADTTHEACRIPLVKELATLQKLYKMNDCPADVPDQSSIVQPTTNHAALKTLTSLFKGNVNVHQTAIFAACIDATVSYDQFVTVHNITRMTAQRDTKHLEWAMSGAE